MRTVCSPKSTGCQRTPERVPPCQIQGCRVSPPPPRIARPAPRAPLSFSALGVAGRASPRQGSPLRTGDPGHSVPGAMWPRLALCCWTLALVAGWANFPQLSPSRNFSFRFFPEAAPGAPGRLLARAPVPGEEDAGASAATGGSKVERLGQAFRRRVRRLRELSERLELVFLVDESSSVGQANFLSELRFVRKLLSDFPVVPSATRVAIVTFSSKNNVVPRVDYISTRRAHQHKCALLSREIPAITYRGGGTYTKGAFQQAAVRRPPPVPPHPTPQSIYTLSPGPWLSTNPDSPDPNLRLGQTSSLPKAKRSLPGICILLPSATGESQWLNDFKPSLSCQAP